MELVKQGMRTLFIGTLVDKPWEVEAISFSAVFSYSKQNAYFENFVRGPTTSSKPSVQTVYVIGDHGVTIA